VPWLVPLNAVPIWFKTAVRLPVPTNSLVISAKLGGTPRRALRRPRYRRCGVFREIGSGKNLNALQSKADVRRMSNERSEIITSRNTPTPAKK
jgi:hypothetical protein